MAAQVSVYPQIQNRSKIIHLVRHGQGIHNAAAEAVEDPADRAAVYLSEEYFDAKLTPLGWTQVYQRRNFVRANGLSDRIELVVVSCLLRTLQTAVGIFGGEGEIGGNPPLMIQDARYSNRPAIPNSNYCPPFLALESCREHLGKCPCDRRRNRAAYEELFPAVNFTSIETGEDVLWDGLVREPDANVALRGVGFFQWLFTRPEKEIAVVSHDGLLHHALELIGQHVDDVAVRAELSRRFGNCEIRSFVMDTDFINSLVANNGAGPAGDDAANDGVGDDAANDGAGDDAQNDGNGPAMQNDGAGDGAE